MSFFESVSLSGQERVHSQVIAWVFSETCSSLLLDEKLKVLSKLTGRTIQSQSISSITEYGDIDILILCDNDAVIIENKIKIQTHSNQLQKYEKISKELPLTKSLNCHFIYLSLFPENINEPNWGQKLHKELYEYLSNANKQDNHDTVLLGEYLKFHKKLVDAQDEFFRDITKFKDVYTYGSLKKIDKINAKYSNDYTRFISQTQLETIFQIAYLKVVADKVGHSSFTLDESHGMALINFEIASYDINGIEFKSHLQYQADVLKFNFAAKNYSSSTKEQLPENCLNFFKNNESTEIWNEYIGFNPPKRKAYVSRSKKITLPCDADLIELVEMLKLEIEKFRNLTIPL